MRKTLYIDMPLGISGDMFSAACYAFMDRELKEEYMDRAGKGCGEWGGSVETHQRSSGSEEGYTVTFAFPEGKRCALADEARGAVRSVTSALGLSAKGVDFSMAIFSDIIDAEAKVHGVPANEVHLHEIGRLAGLFNIASAGLCYDLLQMEERDIIGSAVSVGKGRIMTAHGWLSVPTPASAFLLTSLKSRSGPFEGEMATPTGIAIVKNLISKQVDELPAPGRKGCGFGSKSFEGVVGYSRLFENDETVDEVKKWAV